MRRLLVRTFGSRLPKISGTIRVEGPADEITIRRDTYGIPHIVAANDTDATFAIGFCQGQDRTFQLEMLRRVATGTLSDLVGGRGLAIDRLSRRIGFHRSASRQLWAQPEPIRAQLGAFADGVTAGGRDGLRRAPHELTLLRRVPHAWDAADVLSMTKLVGFMLSTNWSTKLARLRILLDDGPDALKALEPGYQETHPLISPPGVDAGPAISRLGDEVSALESAVGTGLSNNWVIGSDHTSTGGPIVANDPHLNPTVPPQWYLSHIRTPDWEVAGASFAGAPGIVAGHNGHAAWGVTNGAADLCDLWIEEFGPDQSTVRRADRWVPCDTIEERIEVRGGDTLVEQVHVTDRGPVIGPVLEGEVGAISFDAGWLSEGPVVGFLDAHRRRSFGDFRQAFACWPSASLNVVYGDAAGDIGWQFVGEVPGRAKGGSLLPMSAADADTAWTDRSVPFETMPHQAARDDGILVTANNKPVADTTAPSQPYLGRDWTMGYRAMRIREVLTSRTDWDVDSNLELQTDQESLPWREVRGLLVDLDPLNDPDVKIAVDLLRDWDGTVSADSGAAAVFELFLDALTSAVVRVKAPRAWAWALGRGPHAMTPFNTFHTTRLPQIIGLLRDRPAGWFEEPDEFAGDAWDRTLRQCLTSAVSRLRDRFGNDIGTWSWGEFRPLRLPHMLGGPGSPLSAVLDLGPVASGGDLTTVNMCGSNPTDISADPILVPTLRMVVPIGNWDDARFVLSGGQSGNPASAHYDDMFELWKRGEGVPIPWSQDAVRAATVGTLRLVPES